MDSNTFIFKNQIIEYADKYIHNNLKNTERLAELALAKIFLSHYGSYDNLIEIGCVTPYYFSVNHKVYDLTDKHPQNQKMNAKSVDIKDKYVLSISTIEHFNISGYQIADRDFLCPIEWLQTAISKSSGFFITFPMGFNKTLDNFILTSNIQTLFLSRLNQTNRWVQKDKSELNDKDTSYDFSYVTCANTIAIIENTL